MQVDAVAGDSDGRDGAGPETLHDAEGDEGVDRRGGAAEHGAGEEETDTAHEHRPTAHGVGELARRGNDRSVLSAIGVMVVGEAILLTIGTIWLAYDLNVSAGKAISYGVTPFLIGDAVKLVVAALVFPAVWKLVRRS